jgi:membrane-bound lytic murein transglycosylase D
VKNIVATPERLGAELPLIENHPYFQTVTVTRDIDVELAARLADVKLDDFRALNPSMSRPVILAAGTPEILLPWDNAQIFKRNFEAHSDGQYASWTAWSAPETMSVSEAARRVGMSEADLRQVNTIPPRMLIKAGSVLMVPRTLKMREDVTSHLADHGQLSLAPEIVNRRSIVTAGKRDTVASVARRFRLNVADVAEWNNVSAGAALRPGSPVVVYLPVNLGAARASEAPRVSAAAVRPRAVAAGSPGLRARAALSAPRAGAAVSRAAKPVRAAAPSASTPARKRR